MSRQPMVPEPARMRAGDADRDVILSVIQDAFANGRLSTSEVSERQERALTSVYTDELLPIVVDLPEGQGLAAQWGAPAPPQRFAAPVAATTGETRFVVMSGRDYALRPGETSIRNVVIMGGDTIDTSPAFGPGVTVTLHADVIMGGHTIRVPAGVQVIDECQGIMSGNTITKNARGDGSNGTLLLTGTALMGGHTVKLAKR